MAIKITGKNLDVGESLRIYTIDKIDHAVGKYAGRSLSGQISVERRSDGFATHCAVHLASGLDMQASGEGADAYASVDSAVERLEKRLRRYKRRLKQHGQKADSKTVDDDPVSGVDYTLEADTVTDHAAATADHAEVPVVIAETPVRVGAMSVSDAVMQMDLADKTFLVFRNAAHGGVNVVYRRDDGNIGWIDPNGIALSPKL